MKKYIFFSLCFISFLSIHAKTIRLDHIKLEEWQAFSPLTRLALLAVAEKDSTMLNHILVQMEHAHETFDAKIVIPILKIYDKG